MGEIHTPPVMLERIVELLAPALAEPGAVCIDCTLGLGGAHRSNPAGPVPRPP